MKTNHLIILTVSFLAYIIMISMSSCSAPREETNNSNDSTIVEVDTTRCSDYVIKPNLPKNAKLVDENDFYQVFTSVEDCDSVTFTSVWLLDKRDSTIIQVTDPAGMIASGEIKVEGRWDEWYMEEMISLNGRSKSIMSPFSVNLTNNVRHPWRLSLCCYGYRHNYSSCIVSENDSLYKELCNSSFVCRSKYEDIVFFDQVDDYMDWSVGKVTYVVYDKNMNLLRKKETRLGSSLSDQKANGKEPEIIAKGVKVDVNSIGDKVRTHSLEGNSMIVETKADNGDIVSYLVNEKQHSAIKLPVNDEFVRENNIGLVFLSYKTRKDGKRYSVLRLVDEEGIAGAERNVG